MFNSNTPSLSDIAAVTNNNDGFRGGNGWWVLIILLALFGGFRGGYGYDNGAGNGVANNYVLASDFATLQRQIDTLGSDLKSSNVAIANGLSSLGYDQLSQMNGINTNIAASTNALTAQMTGLGTQLQQCCCDNRAEIAQVRYDMATQSCATQRAIADAAQAIIQNDNANYRQLHDENVAIQMSAKDDKIAELTALLNNANLRSSQAEQNAYLLSELKMCAKPAYIVPNPNVATVANYGCGNYGCCAA